MKGMTFTHGRILTRWPTAKRWRTRSAQVCVAGGVSAAYTECQSFTEAFFCHVNYGGGGTDRTQQVSQAGCVWADGKSSSQKEPHQSSYAHLRDLLLQPVSLLIFTDCKTYKRWAGQLPRCSEIGSSADYLFIFFHFRIDCRGSSDYMTS